MRSDERRQAILKILQQADQPISASSLAEHFDVSRQIIVGDIALLRSGGTEIQATPRGYVTTKLPSGLVRQVAVRHGNEETETELNVMVDNGCTVLDVIVEHAIYGQLTGPLQLSNRYEVQQFMARSEGIQPLSLLTEGIHLHTLSCPNEDAFHRVQNALRELGILLED